MMRVVEIHVEGPFYILEKVVFPKQAILEKMYYEDGEILYYVSFGCDNPLVYELVVKSDNHRIREGLIGGFIPEQMAEKMIAGKKPIDVKTMNPDDPDDPYMTEYYDVNDYLSEIVDFFTKQKIEDVKEGGW